MTERARVGWVRVGAIGIAGWLAVLAGCSGDGDEDSGSLDDAAVTEEAGGDASAAPEVDQDGGAGGAPPDESALAVDVVAMARAREVVRTGDVEVAVADAGEAAYEVRDVVAAARGFVADEEVRARSSEVDLTVRVPAAAFDDVRDEIAAVGDVVEQSVEARDVTAEVVDVDTRVASLRASVERLQTLLGQAGDVGQLATVEGELTRRETELEALLGQQRVLADQVELATLAVHLSEDDSPSPDEDAAGFGDGLRRGWVVAVDGGRLALAGVGFLLPLAVPAALVALLVLGVRRRFRPSGSPPAGDQAVS